jgi:hypothetical protein
MRWNSGRNGSTEIYDDAPAYEPGSDEMLIIEPDIISFTPDGWCARCGGALGFRHALDGAHEIICLHCHHVLARMSLGTKARHG